MVFREVRHACSCQQTVCSQPVSALSDVGEVGGGVVSDVHLPFYNRQFDDNFQFRFIFCCTDAVICR